MPLRIALACALFWLSPAALAQVSFEESGAAYGIGNFQSPTGMGNGVAAADLGDDGDIDLFLPNGGGVADQLYRNLGGGQLEEVAEALGVASTGNSRIALWFDHNGDNRLDLLVGADCFMDAAGCVGLQTLTLYEQNHDGSFSNITSAAGLAGLMPLIADQHLGGFAAADLDNDGDLDFYVAEWQMEMSANDDSRLFRNNGDGTFTDITIGSGVGGTQDGRWQPVMFDLDRDGLVDIFSAVDFRANRLWVNQGDLKFVDVSRVSGTDTAFNEMGTALGDPDNDGDIDIYSTNIDSLAPTLLELGIRPEDIPGFPIITRHNVFFQNQSTDELLRFNETAIQTGIASCFWGWGATFLDADLDGWQDLVCTNGFGDPPFDADPSTFFLNNATDPLGFTEISSESGFDDTYWGSSLVAVDLERDGDLDVVQTTVGGPLRVMENTTTHSNRWLVVRPRSQTPNRRAIGATVRATANGVSMTRPITAGISFMGQEPSEAFFGLGSAAVAETVTVEWPDGSVTTLNDVPAGQSIEIMQNGCGPLSRKCQCGDYNEDGALTATDIGGIALCANGAVNCDPSVSDADGDSSTTALDIGGVVAAIAGNVPLHALRCSRNAAP